MQGLQPIDPERVQNQVVPVLQQALTRSLVATQRAQDLLDTANQEISSTNRKFEEKAVELLNAKSRLVKTEDLLKASLANNEAKTDGHHLTINFLMEQFKSAQVSQSESSLQLLAEKRKLVTYESRVKAKVICEVEAYEEKGADREPEMLAIRELTNDLLAAACRLGEAKSSGKTTGKVDESSRTAVFLEEFNAIVAKISLQSSTNEERGDTPLAKSRINVLRAIPTKLSVRNLMANMHGMNFNEEAPKGVTANQAPVGVYQKPLEVIRFTATADRD